MSDWTRRESLLCQSSLCCLVECCEGAVVYWHRVHSSLEFPVIAVSLFFQIIWILTKQCINLHIMPAAAVNHFCMIKVCIILVKLCCSEDCCFEMTWTGTGVHIVAVGWQSARLMTVRMFKICRSSLIISFLFWKCLFSFSVTANGVEKNECFWFWNLLRSYNDVWVLVSICDGIWQAKSVFQILSLGQDVSLDR